MSKYCPRCKLELDIVNTNCPECETPMAKSASRLLRAPLFEVMTPASRRNLTPGNVAKENNDSHAKDTGKK